MNSANELQARSDAQFLRAQLQQATVKLATVQSENRRLRRHVHNGKVGRLLHRTREDATQLVVWRFSDYSVSRRNAATYGMSARRWAWAVAMLRLAKVLPYPGNDADAFQIDDFDECIAAIDRMAAVLAEQDNGIERLVLRMHSWRKRRG